MFVKCAVQLNLNDRNTVECHGYVKSQTCPDLIFEDIGHYLQN